MDVRNKRDRRSHDNFKASIRNYDNINQYGKMKIQTYFKENTFTSVGNKILLLKIQI